MLELKTREEREAFYSKYMGGIDLTCAVDKLVRIRDGAYHDLFLVKDGEEIEVYDPYDNKWKTRRIHFIDAHHFKFDHGVCYHIDQWAELAAKNGFHCRLPKEAYHA